MRTTPAHIYNAERGIELFAYLPGNEAQCLMPSRTQEDLCPDVVREPEPKIAELSIGYNMFLRLRPTHHTQYQVKIDNRHYMGGPPIRDP